MNEHGDLPSSTTPATAAATQLSIEALLPGENAADKQELMMSLMDELAPKTAYMKRLAEQLVDYEWEIERHRRFRDASVLKLYRDYATNMLARGSATFWARPEEIEEEDLLLARDLVSEDGAVRVAAEEDFLEKTNWHPHHILAIAAGNSDAAMKHEARITDLERRRSLLRKEYERYQAVPRPDVEDAEILGNVP